MASHPRVDGSAGWDGRWVAGWAGWRVGWEAGSAPEFTPLFSAWRTRRGWAWLASLCSDRSMCAVEKIDGAVPVLAT